MNPINIAVRDALKFHAVVLGTLLLVLWLERGSALGTGLTALAISYNVLLPMLGLWRGHDEWLALWSFALPLSIAQVLSDLALVKIAHVLVMPDLAQYRFGGEVPLYFAGLWDMLLFPIVIVANSSRSRYLLVLVLSAACFALAEWAARPLGLWHAQNVAMTLGVANYVIWPEIALGLTALWMYRRTRQSGLIARVTGALCVSVFYTGALFVALLLLG